MPISRAPLPVRQRDEVPVLNLDLFTGVLPPPHVLGVQGRATGWRRGQETAILSSIDAETRVVIECLPTGAGKTLIYTAEAVMNGGKVVILTSTKGQQDQITASIEPMIAAWEVVDVRGQMNYRCEAVQPGGEFESENPHNQWVPVADGPCQDGAVCSLKDGGCGYYDRIRAAKKAPIVVTNYAFWMTNAKMEPRFQITDGPVDLLICDEAHESVNEVCDYLAVEISETEEKTVINQLDMRLPGTDEGIEVWISWGQQVFRKIDSLLESRMVTDARNKKKLRKLASIVDRLCYADPKNWVMDTPFNPEHAKNRIIVRFDPVWPLEYAEPMLFRGAKKVIMSSATVRKKTATLLGIKDEDVTIFEAPSTFPVANRPIYRVPCMQMNYRNEGKEGGEDKWIAMVKRITERSVGQGIIHTTSYKRRNLLLQVASRWQYLKTVSHSTSDARSVIASFISNLNHSQQRPLSGSRVTALVSPSVTTGYDFAYDAARWQIIVKLPFADTRAKVMKERCKQDSEYGPYQTAGLLMQATGRVVRAEDDWGETFVIDDNVTWFIKQWKHLFAQWWLDAYIDWGQTMEWAKGRLPKQKEESKQ